MWLGCSFAGGLWGNYSAAIIVPSFVWSNETFDFVRAAILAPIWMLALVWVAIAALPPVSNGGRV